MPRQNKLRHPIKLVREATGLSQKQFAALVGHSKDTIQAIEIGRHKPSLALAEKIFVQTGAVPDTLREMQSVPRDIEGEGYTRDSFERWTSTINNAERPEREKGAIRYLCWLVTTLQHAALRAGKLFAERYRFNALSRLVGHDSTPHKTKRKVSWRGADCLGRISHTCGHSFRAA